jgi:hypothetical protein
MALFKLIKKSEKTGVTKVTGVTSAELLEDSCYSVVTPGNKGGEQIEPIEEGEDLGTVREDCEGCQGQGYGCAGFGRPNYGELADCGLDDTLADCLPGGMFLFAIGMVGDTAQYEFEAMCARHVPYWRKRLDPEAWRIVGGKIKERLK